MGGSNILYDGLAPASVHAHYVVPAEGHHPLSDMHWPAAGKASHCAPVAAESTTLPA